MNVFHTSKYTNLDERDGIDVVINIVVGKVQYIFSLYDIIIWKGSVNVDKRDLKLT
ncbi:hypothetical protein ACSVC9_06550 [Clostridium sp. LBM24168]